MLTVIEFSPVHIKMWSGGGGGGRWVEGIGKGWGKDPVGTTLRQSTRLLPDGYRNKEIVAHESECSERF
jgi:hypothetical protein